MKNGPCPECNSTEIYYATSEDGQGLRDEHSINIRIAGLANAAVETYVCMNCGHIRLFVSPENLADVAVGIGKSKQWKKMT